MDNCELSAHALMNEARKAAWALDFKAALFWLDAAEKRPCRPGQTAAIARLRAEWSGK